MSQNSLYWGSLYQGLSINDKTCKMSPLEKSRLNHHEMLEITVCTYEKNITYFLPDLDKNQIRRIFLSKNLKLPPKINGTQKSTYT